MIWDLNSFYMLAGFLLAAYAVVANDSIQTLGTFINSQTQTKWYYLWGFASVILITTLTWGWFSNGGDLAYGRLDHIPHPQQFHWWHVAAPAVLLALTRYGMPVSTTFLVLSVFASNVILEKMLMKSIMGYGLAAVASYGLWFIISRIINEHLPVKNEKHRRYWRISQWIATGFLWASWLSHDMANIAVYLPRKLSFEWLIFVLASLVIGLGIVFRNHGGEIQKIIINKSGTRFIRSATIIDFAYAMLLWFFKEYNNIPMSTSWVFVGVLTGRELAVYRFHKDKHLKTIFPVLAKDFFKLCVGLAVSAALVVIAAQAR